MMNVSRSVISIGFAVSVASLYAANSGPVTASGATPVFSKLVYPGKDGKLVYSPGEKGDVIPDFSNCGYMGGGVAIPDVPARATIEPDPKAQDDTARIQAAIDKVSSMTCDAAGFRGAVLLTKGVYRVEGSLAIEQSGVVLRGEGDDEKGTVLVATGAKKRTLIAIKGPKAPEKASGARPQIVDEYVPVGARSFRVDSAAGLKPGDTIYVRRRGNKEWIHEIAMDRILPRMRKGRDGKESDSTKQWKPFDLEFDRVIAALDGDRITVDAPIACAIDKKWGGGEICKYADPGRIIQVGVENLRANSEFDKSVKAKYRDGKEYYSDENHGWTLVSIDQARNAWVRNVTAVHFGRSCVEVSKGAKWVTVQDCACLDMVSVLTGGRRYPFVTSGQLGLFQRCLAQTARHAFAVESRVCGPNAFVDCMSLQNYGNSEPHHRWSVGGLYDNVNATIAMQDRQNMGSGHGWAGANYVAWNTEGSLVVQQPPTAQNYAIGHVGKKDRGSFPRAGESWAKNHPGEPLPINYSQKDGHWESLGKHVSPRSLYFQQLEDRLGKQAVLNVATQDQLAGRLFEKERAQSAAEAPPPIDESDDNDE